MSARNLIAVLFTAIAVAQTCFAEDKAEVVLKSTDGASELRLPAGWSESKTHNASTQIMAHNTESHAFVLVITDDRRDLTTDLKAFATGRRARLLQAMTDAKTTEFKSVKVGDWNAVQCEITGVMKKSQLKTAYVMTVLETPNNFHQVVAGCNQSCFETSKEMLEKLPESLHEIADQKSDK